MNYFKIKVKIFIIGLSLFLSSCVNNSGSVQIKAGSMEETATLIIKPYNIRGDVFICINGKKQTLGDDDQTKVDVGAGNSIIVGFYSESIYNRSHFKCMPAIQFTPARDTTYLLNMLYKKVDSSRKHSCRLEGFEITDKLYRRFKEFTRVNARKYCRT